MCSANVDRKKLRGLIMKIVITKFLFQHYDCIFLKSFTDTISYNIKLELAVRINRMESF